MKSFGSFSFAIVAEKCALVNRALFLSFGGPIVPLAYPRLRARPPARFSAVYDHVFGAKASAVGVKKAPAPWQGFFVLAGGFVYHPPAPPIKTGGAPLGMLSVRPLAFFSRWQLACRNIFRKNVKGCYSRVRVLQ